MTSLATKNRLQQLAHEMVNLERLAKQAEAKGDKAQAEALWLRRATIQRMRSDLLRERE